MALITKTKRQRASVWTNALADMAAKAPSDNLKRLTYQLVNNARMEFGMSRREKRVEVLSHVEQGAATVRDLLNELPFIQKNELYELLRELVRDGEIVDRPLQTNDSGPRVSHYFPINIE